jgi:hypothetical protein
MRRSGWVAEDVTVTSSGSGTYHVNAPPHSVVSGTFKMTEKQFSALLSDLEPYRGQAEPYSEESAMRFMKGICPAEASRTYDSGAMYIRWRGPNYDVHFLMDFGCDANRNADHYSRMHSIFERLPLPGR